MSAQDSPAEAAPKSTGSSGEVRSAHSVATVERAADVLLRFAQVSKPTLGVTELADDLALSKAAVHRILAALRSRGLIQFEPESRRYSLGPMSVMLGLSYLERLDVRRLAAPELKSLSEATNETATLSLRTGDTRIYVEQVTPAREVIMSVTMGVPFPLHAGGSSKAFLAFLPPEEIDVYLKGNLAALTENTITDVEALRAELAEARARGYAHSRGERQGGAASVAAPVLDHDGRPCAVVSVCGPAERFAAEEARCASALLAVTERLSRRMGYLPQ